ncbi:MAG TPA: hypothetical protein VHV81_14315 [Steroidobacteraceae bacterium]|nr:hypothetical protein [Steroidobacteraceae bacterium]
MSDSNKRQPPPVQRKGAATITLKDKDQRKAEEEHSHEPISKPGGYANDPKDPTSPNEARERAHNKLHDRPGSK